MNDFIVDISKYQRLFTQESAERLVQVTQWFVPLPHSEKVPNSVASWGPSVRSLHVLLMFFAFHVGNLASFYKPNKTDHRCECQSVCVISVIDW